VGAKAHAAIIAKVATTAEILSRVATRPTWADVSLTTLRQNFRTVQKHVGTGVTVCAVVKADAYGHGAVECSKALEAEGARWLGVTSLDEAIPLREAGVRANILLMTGFNSFSHGTQDLYPTFLQKDHGFSAALTGGIAIIYNIGALLGGIFFGGFSERFGRKRTIIGAALLALPVIPLFAFGQSLYALATGAFLMQFMVQGAWGVIPAYLTELSPGPVRATFPGLAYQLGNLLASRNAVLQARAAEHFGSYGVVLAATVLIVAIYLVIVTAFGREAKGIELTAES